MCCSYLDSIFGIEYARLVRPSDHEVFSLGEVGEAAGVERQSALLADLKRRKVK